MRGLPPRQYPTPGISVCGVRANPPLSEIIGFVRVCIDHRNEPGSILETNEHSLIFFIDGQVPGSKDVRIQKNGGNRAASRYLHFRDIVEEGSTSVFHYDTGYRCGIANFQVGQCRGIN